MERKTRPIFREKALQHYIQGREELTLPQFASPSRFTFLWLLFGLLLVGCILTWFIEVPVYATGFGFVAEGKEALSEDIVLITLLPPETLSRLSDEQKVLLQWESKRERIERPILAVEPKVLAPQTIREQYTVDDRVALAITKPSAVVVAQFKPTPDQTSASTYLGSVYQVDVQVGWRRFISLIPVIGPLFGGESPS